MKMLYIIHSHKCPNCGSTNIHRSKRVAIAEQLACRITPVRPFRCTVAIVGYTHFKPVLESPLETNREMPGTGFLFLASSPTITRQCGIKLPHGLALMFEGLLFQPVSLSNTAKFCDSRKHRKGWIVDSVLCSRASTIFQRGSRTLSESIPARARPGRW